MVAALAAGVAGAALLASPEPAGERTRQEDPPARAGAPAGGAPAGSAAGEPALFAGRAFDTCEAPSLAVMQAWRSSPYGAVGIYIGGRGRGCPTQRELTGEWVASVHAMGWRLLPLFVGSQAPCVVAPAKRPFAIGSNPVSQGTGEAAEAVRAAKALGLAESSPLYLDIEGYRREDAGCAATTLSFVRAWNREVRRLGYLPGFYSSADSGVQDIEQARRAGTQDMPAVMWFARWNGSATLDSEPALHPQAWTPHARIHQYAGDVAESYGGRRLMIDRNVVDAPVARPATRTVTGAAAAAAASSAPKPTAAPSPTAATKPTAAPSSPAATKPTAAPSSPAATKPTVGPETPTTPKPTTAPSSPAVPLPLAATPKPTAAPSAPAATDPAAVPLSPRVSPTSP
ncbi:glycoside hydrolase domain-containing protein [Streptomyces sp. NPDC055055]